MRVIRAEALGLCFGVRDALAATRAIARPEEATIHGELVHNESVLVELQTRGFRISPERSRDIPETPVAVITAHGISDRERQRLEAAGKTLIDTTCPLVRRVHRAAQSLAAEGCHVLIIGRPGHVEVQGLAEDLAGHDVIASIADVRTWPFAKLGVVCQTTTPPDLAAAIHREIEAQNPHAAIRFLDTICQPTRDRQHAVERLCRGVDAVVVVGGANSNNTRQLIELCRRNGTPAFQVQSANGIDPAWLNGCHTVGLTAGTSTLDAAIDEVEARLTALPECGPCDTRPVTPPQGAARR